MTTSQVSDLLHQSFLFAGSQVPRGARPILFLGAAVSFPGLSGGYSPGEWRTRADNEDEQIAGIK